MTRRRSRHTENRPLLGPFFDKRYFFSGSNQDGQCYGLHMKCSLQAHVLQPRSSDGGTILRGSGDFRKYGVSRRWGAGLCQCLVYNSNSSGDEEVPPHYDVVP